MENYTLFPEDEVCRIKKNGGIEVGLVLNNSEFDSSDEEYSDEIIEKGFVSVCWHPFGNEEIISEQKIHLVDRSLMPGDIVGKVNSVIGSKRGFCKFIDIAATVRILGTPYVICNIASHDLIELYPTQDVEILLDSWLGLLINVKKKFVLKFANGSKCILDQDYLNDFKDCEDKRAKNSEFGQEFHIGQKLIGPFRYFDKAEWIIRKGLKYIKSTKLVKVIIEDIQLVSFTVQWDSQTYCYENNSFQSNKPPPSVIGFEEFQRAYVLNYFKHNTLQLSDKNFYIIKENDQIITISQWKNMLKLMSATNKKNEESIIQHANTLENHDFFKISDLATVEKKDDIVKYKAYKKSPGISKKKPMIFLKKLTKRRLKKSKEISNMEINPGDKVVVEIIYTNSKVDVVWQDGVVENHIDSSELYPLQQIDEQDFFPGDFIINDTQSNTSEIFGVIQNIYHLERIAKVHWFQVLQNQPEPIFLKEEEVSVYDIKDHPDLKFRLGTVVIRVANFESDCPNCNVGQVINIEKSGKIEVWWASGHTSYCYPHDLFKIGEYDSDEGELWEDRNESSDDSYITESEHSVSANESILSREAQKSFIISLLESIHTIVYNLSVHKNDNSDNNYLTYLKTVLLILEECKYINHLLHLLNTNQNYLHGIEKMQTKRKDILDYKLPSLVSSNNEHELKIKLYSYISNEKLKNYPNNKNEISKELHNLIENELILTIKEIVQCVGHFEECNKLIDGIRSSFYLYAKLYSTQSMTVTHNNFSKEMQEYLIKTDPEISNVVTSVSQLQISNNIIENAVEEKLLKVNSGFCTIDTMPDSHKFKNNKFIPGDSKTFLKAIIKDIGLLKTSLPPGILVKNAEDRIDLFSAMITGPEKTPYEDCLFFFDFLLPSDYPQNPPLCHYWSYCTDRLNPNLYENGKICVSLLGTWSGKGNEIWTDKSNLLQLLISIQSLILVSEPYYNEAGYGKLKGTQQGKENAHKYNEMVLLKLVQSMRAIAFNPPEIFQKEVKTHLSIYANQFIKRIRSWLELSEMQNDQIMHASNIIHPLPEFSLIPCSKGFCLSMNKSLSDFEAVLENFHY